MLPWVGIQVARRPNRDGTTNPPIAYIPVRFRRQRGTKSSLIGKCPIQIEQLMGFINKIAANVAIILGISSSNRPIIKRVKLKRNSQRRFFLRSVRYKYRKMCICSLLTRTSSYTPKRRYTPHGPDTNNTIANAIDASSSGRKAEMLFDTESFPIKIDNCCTRTMSHRKRDFVVGSMKPVQNLTVKGYGGSNTSITHHGTISWTIQDDNGTSQTLLIPNSFYVPSSTIRLLSPQHMAQQMKQMNDHFPMRRGTWCAMYDDAITLQWNQRKYTKRVKVDPESSNVGTIWSVPGYQAHNRFCVNMATLVDDWNGIPQCYKVNLEESEINNSNNDIIEHKGSVTEHGEEQVTTHSNDFRIDGPISKGDQKEPEWYDSDTEKLLQWHHRLSHVSMARLQRMAK
jgi:hypothetical protein